MKVQHQLNVRSYTAEGFVSRVQRLIRNTVIPYQHEVLWDRVPGVEKSHAAMNFVNAGKALRGEEPGDGFYGMVFQDSDVAKWLEAAAYALAAENNPELEAQVREMIGIVADAQDADGYLDTYFTIKDRDRRWTNLREAHEMYCAGHMIEAACACFEATGDRRLLDVMEKNAEHIYRRFVEEGAEGWPGHPEIELALMKLYRLTGNEHCLALCKHLIDVRGTDPTFYAREAEKRGWSVWGSDGGDLEYTQSQAPVREQKDAVGHAVRAVYLYTAMADLASETGDAELLEACRRLWESITRRQMYVTGGIGSTVHGEAFSTDYDLPPDTAYAETCASIGLMFFASRMLENEVRGEYGDILELAFYNTVLAGMQLDGKRFFYVNPLEVNPGISGKVATQRHDLPTRPAWYPCACCPPNVARLVGSLGKYAYGESADTAYCHLYAAGQATFDNGLRLRCETQYPYDMTVRYRAEGQGTLAVRIPAWSRETRIRVQGEPCAPEVREGYALFPVRGETEIEITLDGTPRFLLPSTRIPRLAGMTALKRGPLVYCFEGVDNGNVKALKLRRKEKPEVSAFREELLGGTVTMRVEARRSLERDALYSDAPEETEACTATAVPYYTWGNRGENEMRVWMNVTDAEN